MAYDHEWNNTKKGYERGEVYHDIVDDVIMMKTSSM